MKPFPTAPKRPYSITQHGETRVDDYFWLRHREDPEVLSYLHAEMDYLEETMQHTKPLQETLFAEMKARMQETDSTVPVKRGEYLYYERTEAGRQYPIFCRRKNSMEYPEEVLLDQNELAKGQPFCSVSAFEVSNDGTKLAYGLDVTGNEVYTIHIKDLTGEREYPEIIPNTYGSVYVRMGVEWSNDNKGFYYITMDESLRPDKLLYHELGTDAANDHVVYHEKDETYFLGFYKSRDDSYIIIELGSTLTSESRYLPIDSPLSEPQIVSPRTQGIEYNVAHYKGQFLILTNKEAKNFKLVKAPVGNACHENWQEVIPHNPDVMLTDFEVFEKYLVVFERRDAAPQARISDPDGVNNVRYIQFPEPTYHFDPQDNSDFETNILRINYSSIITPHSIVNYHMDSGQWELLKEDQLNGYDKSQYTCELIHATASDGKRIPISIAYKKGLKLDGNNPTLLHGYGAYGSILDPEFFHHRISLLDRGFVYAIGHIRGSTTLGRAWYEDGKILKKKNSFTDFITCGEHLIQQGYTNTNRIAIMGVSAGGLLVTASMTLRPDLFKTVVAKVPFVDVINSMSDPTIPLTTHEYDEWGNPAIREQFEYMISYSPYDNVKAGTYPNLLLTAGYNDPRVMYWEPAKFAAKLRSLKADDNVLLLKTNFHAGHAGSSGRYDFLKEVAFEYAFLIDTVC